jgi:phosphohistidine phosphatase
MILYVLRHGVAEDAGPRGDDASRRLTPRGREKMRRAAAGMCALGLRFDVILTSPLPRAAETAALVAQAYRGGPVPRELPALASGVAPAETLRALRPFARHEHVMIVGHEPGLGMLASQLLSGSPDAVTVDLRKGGLIALDVPHVPPTRASGATLRWMLSARHLRRMR